MQTSAADTAARSLFRRGVKERGNHARGTPKIRPSDSSTHMLSSSNLTPAALAEELIPRLFDALTVCLDQPQHLAQAPSAEAVVIGQMHFGPQPEFSLHVVTLNVNVSRLTRRAFVGIVG